MPETIDSALTPADKAKLSDYEPGYDWIPGRFGPPPGIPRQRKQQLDRMTDKDYMAAVLRMGQEEKESLMISEAERLRTYKSLWPNPPCVSYKDLAREGFYYTGVSDRVQCAFCAGFLGNWEAGDNPRQLHKQYFGYCKMAMRKPCANIPLSPKGDDALDTLGTHLVSTRSDNSRERGIFSMSDLGISQDKPVHSRYTTPSTRLGTYKNYSSSHPMKPEVLAEAGFFYEGPGDKVRCFWCDGALEQWSLGDDAWLEHAKWYPGCGFTQQVKGRAFVKQSRSLMSTEERTTAESLRYNSSDTDFLAENQNEETPPSAYDTYQVCNSLGFSTEELDRSFNLNQGEDFSDVQVLIDVLLANRAGDQLSIENTLKQETLKRESRDSAADLHTEILPTTSDRFLDVDRYIKGGSDDMSEAESQLLVAAMTCLVCQKEQIGAALLPCGHFLLCHHCSLSSLPEKCAVCKGVVRGVCRTYLC